MIKEKRKTRTIKCYGRNATYSSKYGIIRKRTINNRAFRNWNSSIYEYYNKTKEYRIKKEFEHKTTYAVPKKIKWD